MSASDVSRVDLLIDLAHPDIHWEPLHHSLEALDEAGFIPHHLLRLSDRDIARVDHRLGGTLGAKMVGGGAWLIEAKGADAPIYTCGEAAESSTIPAESPVLGVAAYLGALSDAPRFAAYRSERDLGLAGPFALDGDLAAHRRTLTLAVLFALRERGYRRALIPSVKLGASVALQEMFGAAVLGRIPIAQAAPPRIVVCASGNGSNVQALIDAVAQAKIAIDLRRVVVNRAQAHVLERARRADIPTEIVLWNRTQESRAEFDQRVLCAVAEEKPDMVLLLGWMHVLAPEFLAEFPEVLNIHPAYLPLNPAADSVIFPDGKEYPAFRGARAVEDALAIDAEWIGATVHRVTAEVDRGAVLARRPIARVSGEDEAELRARLHATEHALVIDAVQRWIDERP